MQDYRNKNDLRNIKLKNVTKDLSTRIPLKIISIEK